MLFPILNTAFLASLTTAAVLPPRAFHLSSPHLARAPSHPTSAISILLQIAPTSNTCAGAPFPAECATATDAAPYLITALAGHGLTHPAELAAVLSLIAFETGDFKYNRNHYPGRPGQGTRNMQMAPFNLQYARSIPLLALPLAAIMVEGGSEDEVADKVLSLLLGGFAEWASAAWFLTTVCDEETRTALRAGGREGWEAYLACIGTEATDDRAAYWERANAAFGIPSP